MKIVITLVLEVEPAEYGEPWSALDVASAVVDELKDASAFVDPDPTTFQLLAVELVGAAEVI